LAAALLGLVAIAATVGGQYLSLTGARREERPLRERLLRRWWDGAPDERDHDSAGSTVGLLTESVERVTVFRQTFLGPMIGTALGPFAVLVVLAVFVDPLSAGLLALALPVIPLTVRGFTQAFRKVSGASRRARAQLANRYLESIQGLETITVLGAAPRVEADLAEVGEANRQATMRLLARNQLVLFVTDAVFSLGAVTASVVLAAWRLEGGAITVGEAMALVLSAILLLAPLDMIGSFFYIGMSGQASQRAMRRFLAGPPSTGRRRAEPVPATTGSHGVEVAGADLGYRGRPVVHGASLDLPAGGFAAVLGPSGSGKSTLVRALKGDLVPLSGRVVVDGVTLTAETQDSVRAASALVAQTTWLFTGTLADNLRLVRPEATDDDLWRALDLVDLAGFVRRTPLGLDTQVGEKGHALSGGQAQRLALARAFLSGRKLLLLDEPTSQVDLHSEQAIVRALAELADDHTIVLVTHRPSTAEHATSRWTMAGGILTKEDTHV
ncbi:ABC transporter ATP-binding protein/permease, partial [Tessaracoccus lubricantis]